LGIMITKERAEEISKEMYQEIFKLVYAKDGIPWHDAEEITQDTFLAFYNKLDILKDDIISSWLKSTATKKCMEYYRKKKKWQLLLSLEDAIISWEDMLITVDNYYTVTKADVEKAKEIILKTLKKDDYTLYYKKIIEGKDYKQIAEEMGITVSNVGTRFSRLRKKVELLAKIAFSGPGQFIIKLFF